MIELNAAFKEAMIFSIEVIIVSIINFYNNPILNNNNNNRIIHNNIPILIKQIKTKFLTVIINLTINNNTQMNP